MMIVCPVLVGVFLVCVRVFTFSVLRNNELSQMSSAVGSPEFLNTFGGQHFRTGGNIEFLGRPR